jgi:hypothetical protein
MERLRTYGSLGVILLALLACKSFGKKEESTVDPSPTTATTDTAAASTDEPAASAAPSASATAAATATAAAPTVKLQDCGERYAAPARLDGQCADYCGVGYTCAPNETCTPSSWPTKSGVRNVAVCAEKGIALRAPVVGAAWDGKAPALATSAAASASGKTATVDAGMAKGATAVMPTPAATVDAVDHPEGKSCPTGWVGIPASCNRPCKADGDCHGKNKCQKLNGARFCDSTKWE